MALLFELTSVAISGTGVQVFDCKFNGEGPVRIFLENAPVSGGGNALTAAKVQLRPLMGATPVDLDTTTFGTLAAGAAAQLLVPVPLEGLRLLATCAAGTTLTVWVINSRGVVE